MEKEAAQSSADRKSTTVFGFDDPNDPAVHDLDLVCKAAGLRFDYEEAMESFAPHKARDEVFHVIQAANKYIDENAPWALAKDMEANGKRLAHVLYNLLEAARNLRHPADALHAESCAKIFAQIGACEGCRTWDSAAVWGSLSDTAAVTKARTSSPGWTWTRPSPSWRPRRPRPGRPPCPPSRWSPSSPRRWTSTPSASPISGW